MKNAGDEQNRGESLEIRIVSNRLLRGSLFVAGTMCTGLGIIGIFVPLLPTTPFLLLAAACFSRSSGRFYNWLLNHRWFGRYIRDYREGKGIPLKAKLSAVVLMWAAILFSTFVVVDLLVVRIVLIVIAAGVSIHLLRLPTLKDRGNPE